MNIDLYNPPTVPSLVPPLLKDYTNVSVNNDYFLFSLNPLSTLDMNTITDDNVVVFPRNIYRGNPVSTPYRLEQPIDTATLYTVGNDTSLKMTESAKGRPLTWFEHPPFASQFTFDSWKRFHGGEPIDQSYATPCPFGYCYGAQSGRNYMLGRQI